LTPVASLQVSVHHFRAR